MDYASNYLMYTLNKVQEFNEFSIKLAYGYIFEFKKQNLTTKFIDDNGTISSYIIHSTIKNNINIPIYKFDMLESDMYRLLDCIGNFLYYMTDTDSSMYIGLPISNSSNMHFPTLYFYNSSRVFVEDNELNNMGIPILATQYFNYETNENRYIDLTIIDDSIKGGQQKQIIKIPMSASEVEDFMYKICLTANIDFGEYLNNNFDDLDYGWNWE